MPNKLYPKKETDRDVLTLARDRYDWLYERFDKIVVGFSGGKDSTVCLMLAIEAAERHKRLPVDAYFLDEEAIPPETVDYVERIAQRDDVRLKWVCGPIKHRNACSTVQPWWYCWGEADRHLWVRDFPARGIVDDVLPQLDTSNIAAYLYGPDCGQVANVVGIRTQESLNRYMAIANNKAGFECFTGGFSIKPHELKHFYQSSVPHIRRAFPIYDWTHEDVWLGNDLLHSPRP